MSAAAKPEATIGVGDGSGQLFVHGSHEAVKRVQSIILEVERLQDVVARLSPSDEETRYTADQDWTGLSGATAWHLAERHGEGWAGIGAMMEAWRDAEVQRITAGLAADLARAQEQAQAEIDRLLGHDDADDELRGIIDAVLEGDRLPVYAELEQMTAERDAAQAELKQAREVLRGLEWMFLIDIPSYPYVCPYCGALQGEGHAPDCKLNAALAAKE